MRYQNRDPLLHLHALVLQAQAAVQTHLLGDLPVGTLVDDGPVVGVITGERDAEGRVRVLTAGGGGVWLFPHSSVTVLADPSTASLLALASMELFRTLRSQAVDARRAHPFV